MCVQMLNLISILKMIMQITKTNMMYYTQMDLHTRLQHWSGQITETSGALAPSAAFASGLDHGFIGRLVWRCRTSLRGSIQKIEEDLNSISSSQRG